MTEPTSSAFQDHQQVAEKIQQLIQAVTAKKGEGLNKDQQYTAAVSDLVTQMMRGECAIRDIIGFDDKQMEALYAMAFNFYRSGRYDEALKIFRGLCLFDQLEPKYWVGLGATLQMLNQFPEAVQAYAYAGTLDITDPKPAFHAAECYIALNDKENAISALTSVVDFANADSPDVKPFVDKAKALLKVLEGEGEAEAAQN